MYVQNALRVSIQNVSVCTGITRTCVSTCARGGGTHGDTGVLSVIHCTAPHTPRPRHTPQTTQTPHTLAHTGQHAAPHGDRDRERQRQTETERQTKKTETERGVTRQDKTRQEKTKEKGEKMKDKTREDERDDEREEKRDGRKDDFVKFPVRRMVLKIVFFK